MKGPRFFKRWNRLPTELKRLIALHVDDLQTINHLSGTCIQMKNMCRDTLFRMDWFKMHPSEERQFEIRLSIDCYSLYIHRAPGIYISFFTYQRYFLWFDAWLSLHPQILLHQHVKSVISLYIRMFHSCGVSRKLLAVSTRFPLNLFQSATQFKCQRCVYDLVKKFPVAAFDLEIWSRRQFSSFLLQSMFLFQNNFTEKELKYLLQSSLEERIHEECTPVIIKELKKYNS